MMNIRRARPDTMNTYMKNLPKEREEGRERERERVRDHKVTNAVVDNCLRLSVKSFF